MTCDVVTAGNELPEALNLTIYQAATFEVELIYSTGNPAVPVDLTGYTADMKVKNGGNLLVELSTSNGRITLGTTDGTITLLLSATETAALAPGSGEYDLLLTSGSGVVVPLVAGSVYIRQSVSGG